MKKELLEKSILSTMLAENYLITDSGLQPDMFMGRHHQQLFAIMQELRLANHPVDYLTLSTRDDVVDQIGLHTITELLPYANLDKFDDYVALLRENWVEQRKKHILFRASQGDWSIPRILQALDDLQIKGESASTAIMPDLMDMVDMPFVDEDEQGLIVPHIDTLAKLIDGFRPGELTVLAGRPSMGKTDVMNNLALHAGRNGALPLIFSLEMSRKLLVKRLVANAGNYSRLKLRKPKRYLTEEQKMRWMDSLEDVHKSGIEIDDRSGLSLGQIRTQARRVIRMHPDRSPIIFIDYLQIINTESNVDNTTVALSKVSRGLKQMAKELNCPVVCLSQLNRNVETRSVKRPVMSDLRDSGSIEQDADVIILLYRASYYETAERTEKGKGDVLELIVAKNRNGPTGTAFANYFMKTGLVICSKDERLSKLEDASGS